MSTSFIFCLGVASAFLIILIIILVVVVLGLRKSLKAVNSRLIDMESVFAELSRRTDFNDLEIRRDLEKNKEDLWREFVNAQKEIIEESKSYTDSRVDKVLTRAKVNMAGVESIN